MAGPHLERLRAQKSQKRAVEPPSKPSKPGFEGFEGGQGTCFLENNRVAEGGDVAVKNSKNPLTAHPQNLQNLNSPSVSETISVSAKVEIIELPQAQRYRKAFAHLQTKPPSLIEMGRWRQCIEDGKRFLAKWGEQAEALGWTSADLFGLHTPEQSHPSYNRLSRYDATGLCWLLQCREVVALTADTAAIENPTGNVTNYRKHNKPALGPLGDSLEDLK
jgi:hypothetical protein